MQRLFLLLLCFAPLTASAMESQAIENSDAVTLTASDRSRIALSINSTTMKCEQVVENGLTMEQMVIPGEGCLYVEGKPMLPAISRLVVVPPDKSIELVVREGESHRTPANLPLVICNEKSPGETEVLREQDDTNELIPAVTAEMSEPMVIRGVRLVRVTTYPVQFDPATKHYIIRDNLEAELRFGDSEPINPAFHPVRSNRSRTFLKFIRGLAINGDEVGRDDPDYDVDPPYVGHYLVVVHASVLQYAVPFIEWRRKSGYKVDILSVPADRAYNPNWIKGQIQDIYDDYLDQGVDPFDLLMLIGDHGGYGGNIPGQQYVLDTPSYGWDYGCLEGGNNDYDVDVGIAQWIAGSQDQMLLNTGRTLGYEMTPYFENTEWFSRGAVFSQHWGNNWNPSLNTNVRWAREMLKRHSIEDVSYYEGINDNDNGAGVTNFLIEQYNDGVNLLFGRAQAYPIYGSWGNVGENTIFPIYINYAGHQEIVTWMMVRGWDGRHLKGPVVATDIYGAPQTYSNSLLWLETINGLMQKDLPFGWARVNAVMAPQLYIPNFAPNGYNRAYTASYGDPGLQPWLGVPHVLHTEFPETITSETRRVDILVIEDETDEPFEGAQVTLYFPGAMPAANHADYPTYNQMLMLTQKSDVEGMARFVFDEETEFVNDTRMYVTVTGRDVKPSLDTCIISTPDAAVELSSYSLSEVQGNGDEFPNPGESFNLHISAKNNGDTNTLQGVTATLSSNSPYLEVSNTELSFGDIEPGQEQGADDAVQLSFDPACPDGVSRPALAPEALIEFRSGDERWISGIKLASRAPHFRISQIVGGAVISDSSSQLELEIENIGSAVSRDLTATLESLGMGVNVLRAQSSFNALEPGQNGGMQGEAFSICGNKVVVPGSITPMQLILRDDLGFCDTTTFTLQVMRSRERAPQGPDAYGYVCYDDSDSGWDATPEYEWAEIDPEAQEAEYDGSLLEFTGRSQYDVGEALVVDLPFVFSFYGTEFEQITVSTNGFIAVGDQEPVTNYQNWPLDRAIGGGAGMIAPFWDNLQLGQNGAIYTFHDEENGRFIIEWSRLRHQGNGNNDLTFEVIISDPAIWVSETGDPNILFQYKSISNVQGNGMAWVEDTPFASVGISSPMGNTGINYSFANQYPVTSAPLQNRRAILFTASPFRLASFLCGWLTDAQTGLPVADALVRTRHGYVANTDEDGYWSITKAPSDIPFNITASKIGYNDSTYNELEVAEDDTLQIDFALLHPEFTISNDRLGASIEPGQSIELPFRLDNTGNGPLTWAAEKRLPGNADASPWTLRLEYAAGDTLNDDRLEGVVFTEDHFYLAGANGSDSSMIYVLDRAGNLERQFEQPCHTRYGMKDLEWSGDLLWGSGDTAVYGFSTEGELVNSWRGPFNPCNNIAYDSDRQVLWISGTTTNIVSADLEGNFVDTLNRKSLRIYGLSYWPEDPEGYNLYITTFAGGGSAPVIFKMNTETGDTIRVKELEPPGGSTGIGGGFITNQFDVYSWVFMTIPNVNGADGSDRVYIYQLDTRKDWMELDSYQGLLQTGEGHDFTLTLRTEGLPDTLFEGMMRFTHNADDNVMILDIALDIMGEQPPAPFGLIAPADGDTLQALPMHGGVLQLPPVTFVWQPTDDPNDLDTIRYRFNMAVGDRSVNLPLIADTSITLNPDTLGLPITFDRLITWWVEAVSGEQVVGSNSPFRLVVIPDESDRDKYPAPFKFGLEPVWPNPFNGSATVKFSLEKAAFASLKLYDLSGRIAAVLFEGESKAGLHKVALDGDQLASGVYLLKLESAGQIRIEKITLIR